MLRRPGLRRRRIQNGGVRKRPYFEDVSSINFGDYSFADSSNRRVSSIDDDYFYGNPGIRDIPGRIQTLLPYSRDELTDRNFNFKRPTKSKSTDCDYYTDSLCLEVGDYPV